MATTREELPDDVVRAYYPAADDLLRHLQHYPATPLPGIYEQDREAAARALAQAVQTALDTHYRT